MASPSKKTKAPAQTAAAPEPKLELVKVRVACKHPIGEDGITRHLGEEFELTQDRAAALGIFVTLI